VAWFFSPKVGVFPSCMHSVIESNFFVFCNAIVCDWLIAFNEIGFSPALIAHGWEFNKSTKNVEPLLAWESIRWLFPLKYFDGTYKRIWAMNEWTIWWTDEMNAYIDFGMITRNWFRPSHRDITTISAFARQGVAPSFWYLTLMCNVLFIRLPWFIIYTSYCCYICIPFRQKCKNKQYNAPSETVAPHLLQMTHCLNAVNQNGDSKNLFKTGSYVWTSKLGP
jgi:hypothetical protein